MSKIIKLGLCMFLGLLSFSFLVSPSYIYADDYYDWDYSYGYDYSYGSAEAGAVLLGGTMLFFTIGISLALYVYLALAIMKIAKDLGYENSWFAWVPILNVVLLYQIGDQNPLLLLLLLIPGIGALAVGIISVIALMNICEKKGHDKLLGLLALVPIANLVLFGVLAWGKKN